MNAEGARCAVVVTLGVGDEARGSGAETLVSGLIRHRGWGPAAESVEWFAVNPDLHDGLLQPRDVPALRATGRGRLLSAGELAGQPGGARPVAAMTRSLEGGDPGGPVRVASLAAEYPSARAAAAALGARTEAPGGAADGATVRWTRGRFLHELRVAAPDRGRARAIADEAMEALEARLARTPDSPQPVHRYVVRRPDGLPDVDIYEFFWADASRFPAALRSFLAAFLGLFLQITAAGRAALRRDGMLGAEPVPPPPRPLAQRARRADRALLGATEWLLAVPVMIASLGVLALVGVLALALLVDDQTGVLRVGAPLAAGALVAVLAVVGLLRYERSGRPGALVLGAVFLVAAATLAIVRVSLRDGDVVAGLCDTLTCGVAFPFRGAWLLLYAAAAATIAAMLIRVVPARAGDDSPRRAALTGATSLAIAPLGVALLLALGTAAVGGLVKPLADRTPLADRAGSAGGTPWGLEGPGDWRPWSGTPAGWGDDLTAWGWGAGLHEVSVAPLVVVVPIAAAALVVLGLVWMVRAFQVLPSWRPPAAARGPAADAVAGSRQADRLWAALWAIERAALPLLALAVVAGAYAAASCWWPVLPLPWRDALVGARTGVSGASAVVGGALAVFFVGARRLGWSPGALATGGRAQEVLRAILDRPYDIASFLREPVWTPGRLRPGGAARAYRRGDVMMPRERILRRYRALLRHLGEGGAGEAPAYERIVFVSHSQGTVLTTTLLADEQPSLPDDARLITFGCPLRQLYHQRLPRQFGWVGELDRPGRFREHVRGVGEWWNLASPGDAVGRTVTRDVGPGEWAPSPRGVVEGPAGETPRDVLLEEGGHGVYWDHPVLFSLLDRQLSPARSAATG